MPVFRLVAPFQPTGDQPEATLGWMELGFPVLAIGLGLVVVSRKSRRYSLIPVGDPKLERGLNFRL